MKTIVLLVLFTVASTLLAEGPLNLNGEGLKSILKTIDEKPLTEFVLFNDKLAVVYLVSDYKSDVIIKYLNKNAVPNGAFEQISFKQYKQGKIEEVESELYLCKSLDDYFSSSLKSKKQWIARFATNDIRVINIKNSKIDKTDFNNPNKEATMSSVICDTLDFLSRIRPSR